MNPADLPLHDVHLPPAPSWWPPAMGWWWVFIIMAVLVMGLLVGAAYWYYRRTRQARWLALFDRQLAKADNPAAQLAVASELLRRAARRVDRKAVQLQGKRWLAFLDGKVAGRFSQGAGRILIDGSFRRHLDIQQARDACQLARNRFVELMAGQR